MRPAVPQASADLTSRSRGGRAVCIIRLSWECGLADEIRWQHARLGVSGRMVRNVKMKRFYESDAPDEPQTSDAQTGRGAA